MNTELLDLKAFITVAELGSFVRTAKALNLSPPALSRRIQKLEESLGAPLFERSTRHVSLTMTGRDFLPKVRRLIDEFETSVLAFHDLGARSSGLVSVAAVPSAVFGFLPRAIGRFTEVYPRIRIRILDIGANEGLEAVVRGEVDFGINFIGASDAEIEFQKLGEDPFVLACRYDHPLASRKRVSWAELTSHRVITVGRKSGNRALIDNALVRHGNQFSWTYEVARLSGLLGLVEAGLGVAVLPRLATPTAGHPMIRTIRLIEPQVCRTIGIVRRRGTTLSPHASQFLKMLLAVWPSLSRMRAEALTTTVRAVRTHGGAAHGAAKSSKPKR
jgi:DNA-binding transcriptional LysR family regulator